MKINKIFSTQKILLSGLIYLFLLCSNAWANGLTMSNLIVSAMDTTADTMTLQFDITWNNSWRDSINYDAAWIFVKYSTDSGTTWNHATMKTSGTNPSGTSDGSGTGIELVVSADKKGCFVQRDTQGSGTLATTAIQIVWNYAADGVSDSTAAAVTTVFKFTGIEMVYVSQGGFYIGDGTDATNNEIVWEASVPGSINSETEIVRFGASRGVAGEFFDVIINANFTISGSYPKGYAPFYAMKYEVTEGQWVDFFNSLTSAQQTTRDITSATNGGKAADSAQSRNTVSWTSGSATTTRSDRACSYLAWMDLAAYLDWAALRPMTEFEYEKACRGPLYPVAGEYAWGTTGITTATTISGTENGTETITTTNGNAAFNATVYSGGDASSGPLRAGIFATSTTTTRVTSGASYYGIMELSGNLWERTASIDATGRGFSGTHGDGVLTSTSSYEGNATNLDWPGLDTTSTARGISGAAGSNRRGGAWGSLTANLKYLHVSDRDFGETADATRDKEYGGRGVRTASA